MRSSLLAPSMPFRISFRPKLLVVLNPGTSSSSNGSGMVRSVISCRRSMYRRELSATATALSAVTELTSPPMIRRPTTASNIHDTITPVIVANTYLKNDFITLYSLCPNIAKLASIYKLAALVSFDEAAPQKLRPYRTRRGKRKFILFCIFTPAKNQHVYMSDETNPIPEENHSNESSSQTIPLSGLYENWFLDYASYVILDRAVPHINDGFKPVQRRILHSLKEMDDGRFNKAANVIGNTMKYHPHGDASIGDAMVQIGQKNLLIDCQGNWGDPVTGDAAAAPRYIEGR